MTRSNAINALTPNYTSTGTLTNANDTVQLTLEGCRGAAVLLNGTWTGTVAFESSVDGSTWISASTWNPVAGDINEVRTANGQYEFIDIAGCAYVRVRFSVASSGTVNVTINGSQAASTVDPLWSILFDPTAGGAGAFLVPQTFGGLSTYRRLWPNNTTGVNIKNSGGQIYGWQLYNNASAIRVVKLYDKATAPTTGTDTPSQTIVLASNSGINVFSDIGFTFANGIGIAVTTGVADADTTAPTANDVIVNLFYK